MRILQINLNHAKLAHNLLYQTAIQLAVDLVLISEPLRNPGSWIFTEGTSNAAIWVTGNRGLKNQEDGNVQGEDFVAVRIGQMTVISVYMSPNVSPELYAKKLDKLESFIKKERKEGRKIIIGGGFNAKSPAWGSKEQSTKGTLTLEMLLDQNLYPVIPIGGPTFERRNASSVIDFVASSPEIQEGGKLLCKVLRKESGSDHKYLLTEVEMEIVGNLENPRICRWKVTPQGLMKLGRVLDRRLQEGNLVGVDTMDQTQIEGMLKLLPEVCDEALEKTGQRRTKRENPWWNKEIEAERRKAQSLRRQKQRANKKGAVDEAEALYALYKHTKKELNKLILKAKDKSWDELCNTIEKDVWGKPYKSIMKRVKGVTPPPALSGQVAEKVMLGLFPQEYIEERTNPGTGAACERRHSGGQEVRSSEEDFPKITTIEIQKAG
ncbi:uncharacterized protein LOC143219877 [Lasioglossum baleicum]|uniref:uncharacterized protein LOC143219877 n=1 Tax=Lasioglossum baleicum TaxID=434251 RepID=UPI003FCE5B7E